MESPKNGPTRKSPGKDPTRESPRKGPTRESPRKCSIREFPRKGPTWKSPRKGLTMESPRKGPTLTFHQLVRVKIFRDFGISTAILHLCFYEKCHLVTNVTNKKWEQICCRKQKSLL